MGSRRLLDGLAHGKDVTALVLEDNYGNIFEEVERVGKDKKVAFLVSEIPCFTALASRQLKVRQGELRGHTRRQLFPIRLLPVEGSWKDYRIYSLHGAKDADIEGIFEGNKRFILLLDMEHNLRIHKGAGLAGGRGQVYFSCRLEPLHAGRGYLRRFPMTASGVFRKSRSVF